MSKKPSVFHIFTLTFYLLSLVLTQQTSQSSYEASLPIQTVDTPFPQSLTNEMASRHMRYHHFLWHNVRDNWNRFNESVKEQIRNLGWEPPRPSRNYTASGGVIGNTDNDSGEDFFYMHRQMIAKANEIITLNNESYGNVTGWKNLPYPNDTAWPVPSPYTVPSGQTPSTATIASRKTDDFFWDEMVPVETRIRNPAVLRGLTLGELGSLVEFTVHTWLHTRYSNESRYGYRPRAAEGGFPYIDKKWDDPQYVWLPDVYASHVDPVFWKLHGWVDDRAEDWRIANNLEEIVWNGTWEGGPMENLPFLFSKSMAMSDHDMSSEKCEGENCGESPMEGLMKVLMGTGIESSFSDKVEIDVEGLLGMKPKLKREIKIGKRPKLRKCRRRLMRNRAK